MKILFLSLLLSHITIAAESGLYSGTTLTLTPMDAAVSTIQPGTIVIVGENHGLKSHQLGQLAVMHELRSQGHEVSVGMEFFYYPDQRSVNAWRAGKISEEDFLKKISWAGFPFYLYRAQALFPRTGSHTIALNAPKWLTKKIGQQGLSSLTQDDWRFMPPNFSVGRDSYKKRFLEMMPHLPSPEAADRYFAAQSTWDDTMAYRAVSYMKRHPRHVLVIVVGAFHVDYGGGLPDRIRARAPKVPVVTISQVNGFGLSDAELQAEMAPHAEYGPRAHYLWLSSEQTNDQ